MTYNDFISSKEVAAESFGFEVPDALINQKLFPWQRDVVRRALAKGRFAMFEECGLGKTGQQLEWGRQVHLHTGGDVLILCPLAVAHQTKAEGEKFGIEVTVCRSQSDVRPGVNVTNYERLHLFNPEAFVGVVLDESSILKAFMGATKRRILQSFKDTPYKLACTATPAPNDHLELGNHAEFLGVMRSNEMISRWFINDTMAAGSYRLKHHAEDDFWSWVCSWSVGIDKPSDLGYPDEGFILPPLELIEHVVEVDHSQAREGELFRYGALSATNLHKEMRLTAPDRAAKVAALVNGSADTWIVWCNTNYEEEELKARIPDAIVVNGQDPPDEKERKLDLFGDGGARVIITKPSIAGYGLNWQHVSRMAFVGLSYSYEDLYQALRRSWRFGQSHPVEAHIVIAESEAGVLATIREKQAEHLRMKESMTAAMRNLQTSHLGQRLSYEPITIEQGKTWKMYHGDCVEVLRSLEPDSVGFSVFSPPFAELYIYSASPRDMGNAANYREFFKHFRYLIPELLRVVKPGRLVAVHCKDLPLYRGRDGAMGLRDFPGELIRAFEHERGEGGARFVYHSRVTIWKDPVIEMQRTKNHGLLYKELCKDSCGSRQGMADYMLMFRKWTDSEDAFPDPVFGGKQGAERFDYYVGDNPPKHYDGDRHYSIQVWQRYASPVWFDIDQTDVLNYQIARENQDEKHICPLQLGVIRRSVQLWTNPGDLVLSPFAGIGSEGFCSVEMGRRFIGAELKRSYFEHACRNLAAAEASLAQGNLFGEEAA